MVIAVALLVAACAGAPPASTMDVTLEEFSIRTSSSTLAAGGAELTIRNVGSFGHTVVITDERGTVVSATDVIPSMEDVTLPVDLQAGTYQLTCRIVFENDEGDIVDHYERGMRTGLDVRP